MFDNQYCFYDTMLGRITISCANGFVTTLKFGEHPNGQYQKIPLADKAAEQIDEYLSGCRREFDIPLKPRGTEFQLSVWNQLLKIPYGETRSYSQIASAVGNPNALRAVGAANNKNPIAILIPCHRVIGADGSLTGYAYGLDTKKFLLSLEGSHYA